MIFFGIEARGSEKWIFVGVGSEKCYFFWLSEDLKNAIFL